MFFFAQRQPSGWNFGGITSSRLPGSGEMTIELSITGSTLPFYTEPGRPHITKGDYTTFIKD
jgi:hypothetical protein